MWVLPVSPNLVGQGEHYLRNTPVGHLLTTTAPWQLTKAGVSTFDLCFQTFGFLCQMPRLTETMK